MSPARRVILADVISAPAAAVVALAFVGTILADDSRLEYSRDIRPILSNHCFKCHGPDSGARKAELRLDTPEGAFANRGDYQAIAPGKPDTSAILERVASSDPETRMPPAGATRPLTSDQIDRLRRWIAQGARYDLHWAFRPIVRPLAPPPTGSSWGANPVDVFILRKLRALGLEPSPEADRSTVARRLYLDLAGLAPDPDVVDRFRSDTSPDAYDRLVDRVLANPHFGEKWGRHWLDQARYADTHGYTVDTERSMWPYRDWVIGAFNADLPFDRFTIEQLAGDLLRAPTRDQLVATGFHRNTLVNQEGGTDAEQFRVEAVVDRVNTTGAVWLGLTVGCAQCHTHKYDPLTQREYYQLLAFFNSGQDVNSIDPIVRMDTPEQTRRLVDLDAQVADAQARFAEYDRVTKAGSSANEPADGSPIATSADAKAKPADPERDALQAKLKQIQSDRAGFLATIPTTMVMKELSEPRPTHVLTRGDFLRKGDPVTPGGPAFLPAVVTDGAPANRLDLARWLVRPDHPLTSRVTVNRVWMRLFGQGLVETENDFGFQGTPPTHPELLDWLAARFIEQGWSIKHLIRTIVTSATYRQSSLRRPDAENVDPLNRLLARQSRVRVDAEIIRDLALLASGLLEERIGGPSVYPPQPDGVYAFTQRAAAWPTNSGPDRYRRGIYTFFMRSAPHPMLTTFDTPAFQTTCTRRGRSNTPLQSLALANDQSILEASRALAGRLLSEPGTDPERIDRAFARCLSRSATAAERDRLVAFVEQQRSAFGQSPADAQALSGTNAGDPSKAVELAAWTLVARVFFNLDEFITRE